MKCQSLYPVHTNVSTHGLLVSHAVSGPKRYNIAEDRNPTRATLRNPPQMIAFAIRCTVFSAVCGTAATHIDRAVHTPVAGRLSATKLRCLKRFLSPYWKSCNRNWCRCPFPCPCARIACVRLPFITFTHARNLFTKASNESAQFEDKHGWMLNCLAVPLTTFHVTALLYTKLQLTVHVHFQEVTVLRRPDMLVTVLVTTLCWSLD
jgi:hypothetical protein